MVACVYVITWVGIWFGYLYRMLEIKNWTLVYVFQWALNISGAYIGDKDEEMNLGKSEDFFKSEDFLSEGRLVCDYAEIWVKICMGVFNLAL